ncbi:MAG: hypothetical protein Q7R31_04910 [Candidatus Levybacteria bacterium]|nr:hypothetical protein [Candidatus Levybacteria bacterium]
MKLSTFLLDLFLCALIFSLYPRPVFAVTVTINNYPSTITDEPFTVTASISGATAGTNYLRIDIFKDQTTNYFGETFNGSDWYGGSTYSQYLPVAIQSGTVWGGSIQGRIGNPNATDYDGNGTYKIRLRRYTSGGGSTATEANNSAVVVTIALPTSTPTPTLTPTPTPTPAPTSTPVPTNTPTPKPTPTLTPTPSLTPTPVLPTEVLGESTKSAIVTNTQLEVKTTGASKKKTEVLGEQTNNTPKILIGLGILFLASCGILFFRFYIKNKKQQKS